MNFLAYSLCGLLFLMTLASASIHKQRRHLNRRLFLNSYPLASAMNRHVGERALIHDDTRKIVRNKVR
jgi:hypothetical protein